MTSRLTKEMVAEALNTLETEVRSEWGYNGDAGKMRDMSDMVSLARPYNGHPSSIDTHMANDSFALLISLVKIEVV